MAEKKQEFVVSDRRRFAPEGELRTDAPVAEEEKPAALATPPPPPQEPVAVQPEQSAAPEAESEEMPPPPTAQEQQEQTDAYKASGKKLDEIFSQTTAGQRRGAPAEMTFERLIESFYMTALLQLGAIRQENEPPAVDIIGARQTIDSLTILQEKTKGNLTEREQHLLQNILFELRMAWIEITNAIASGPATPGGAAPPGGIKK